MDTVKINGVDVPITEVVAKYTRAEQLEKDVKSKDDSLAAANQQLQQAATAVSAIDNARTDPAFARQLSDRLAQMHAGSAHFQQEAAPPPPPVAPEGAPVIPPAPAVPGTQIPTAPVGAPNLELARQFEDLQREVHADRNQRALQEKMAELVEQYPGIDATKLLKAAIDRSLPLEHLDLLASDFERERLAEALKAKDDNNELLEGLLSGGGGKTDDENLSNLGLSVSAAQLQGDANVDYASLDTGDALALAMAQVGKTTV